MYIYIYTHICIYIYIYVCICTYVYVHNTPQSFTVEQTHVGRIIGKKAVDGLGKECVEDNGQRNCIMISMTIMIIMIVLCVLCVFRLVVFGVLIGTQVCEPT